MLRPMRILLAEDERTVSRLITQVLAALGHDVTGVQSAAEAIEALGGRQFDLVLLDLNLVDGDGMRVVDAMQTTPRNETPVVLMTGEHVQDADDPRFARVAGVLSKPFEIDELERTVRRFSA